MEDWFIAAFGIVVIVAAPNSPVNLARGSSEVQGGAAGGLGDGTAAVASRPNSKSDSNLDGRSALNASTANSPSMSHVVHNSVDMQTTAHDASWGACVAHKLVNRLGCLVPPVKQSRSGTTHATVRGWTPSPDVACEGPYSPFVRLTSFVSGAGPFLLISR